MPLFDFECEPCGYAVETLIHHHTEVVICTRCHQPMRKLPGASAFVVKGYNAKNHYCGTVREVKVAGQKDMKVTVKEG